MSPSMEEGCASLVAQMVKNLPAMREAQVLSLGPERSPRARERQHTPIFLPGKFHGQRSLVFKVHEIGLQSTGSQRVRQD